MPDVVVVGAGIAGSSAAMHLARRGASVVLVEADLPGRATTAGAGIISPLGLEPDDTAPAWTRLVDAATGGYPDMVRTIGDGAAARADFAVVGEVVLATTADERRRLDELADRVRARQPTGGASGAEPVLLAGADLLDRWPAVDPDVLGLFVPGTARVDGNGLAGALRDAAVAAGAAVVHGRAELRRAGARGVVRVDGRDLVAGAVVLATGAWAGPMLATAGVGTAVTPDRGQIVHLHAPFLPTGRLPVLKTFDGPYVLGFDGDRVVAGATHDTTAGFDGEVRAGDQLTVLSDALRVAPGLAAARILETRVGLRPASGDHLPLVGRSALDDVWVLAGLGSWGLTLGPFLGERLAGRVLGDPADGTAGLLDPMRTPPGRTAPMRTPPGRAV